MNSLGRDPRACIEALDHYLASITAIDDALDAESGVLPSQTLVARLRPLVYQMSVDALARKGAQAQLRMTAYEARFLAPALAEALEAIEQIDRGTELARWRPALVRAAATLERAARRIGRVDTRRRRYQLATSPAH